MGNFAFEYKDTIDYKRINAMGQEHDEILIGFQGGIPHVPGDESAEITDMAEDAKKAEISDMAEDAKKLSFGTSTIPARPFLEEGMNAGRGEITQAIEAHYKKKLEDGIGNLVRIAITAVGAIQVFVRSGSYRDIVPNAPSTIQAKSNRQKSGYKLSDIPLIDTSRMIDSVTYVINGEKGGK